MNDEPPNSAPAMFESGVADYFRTFGHRQARERCHQAWLLYSVAKYIPPQLVVAELTLPNQDVSRFGGLAATSGAMNFDFAVTRSEIDLRTWKTRTAGWKTGTATIPKTLETLKEVVVLAELKIAESTSTNHHSLARDIHKLACAVRFLLHHHCTTLPACYFVVLDPRRALDLATAMESTHRSWPKDAPFPKILDSAGRLAS